jgi:hypothetical protein
MIDGRGSERLACAMQRVAEPERLVRQPPVRRHNIHREDRSDFGPAQAMLDQNLLDPSPMIAG